MTTLLLLLIQLLRGAGVPVQMGPDGHVVVVMPARHSGPQLREASPGGDLDLTQEFSEPVSDISNGY